MVNHGPIQKNSQVIQENWSMHEYGKRRMMYHATSTSMCHSKSSQKWLMTDGQVNQIGEVFSIVIKDLSSLIG
jgi:hypothetical protein